MIDIDCPSIQTLVYDSYNMTPCYHHVKNRMETVNCAERNVKLLSEWFSDNWNDTNVYVFFFKKTIIETNQCLYCFYAFSNKL